MATKIYSPSEAAKLAGISASSARGYVKRYTDYFSSEATPPKGQPRAFTVEDVRLLRFISQATRDGATHNEVAQRLVAGELDAFDWWPELEEGEGQEQQTTALTTMHQLQLVARLFDRQVDEYRLRDEEGRQREQDLTRQLLDARQQIGKLEGQLEEMNRQEDENDNYQPWWRRLFSG